MKLFCHLQAVFPDFSRDWRFASILPKKNNAK